MPTSSRSNWWSRNWKWFVPTGCLSLLVLLAAMIFGALWLVFAMLKSNEVYRQAVTRAERDPAVIAALGEPIRDGRFISGSMHSSDDTGDAALVIPLSGPKGDGKLYVKANKTAGEWRFARLLFTDTQTRQQLELVPANSSDHGGN